MNNKEKLFVILNLIDFSTTYTLLSLGGEEIMPLGVFIIENYGMPGLLIYKMLLTAVVVVFSRWVNFRDHVWELLNGVFSGIVTWNNLGIAISVLFI